LGHSTQLLGHCHPAVVSAVKAQVERGNALAHITLPTIALAQMLVEAVPCAAKVRLTNSGTEAVLLALRLVRAFTGRDKVLKFEGAYHGFGDPLLFNTNYGQPDLWHDPPWPTPDSLGIPDSEADRVIVAPYNDIDRTRQIVRHHQAELAAVVVEPLQRGLAPLPGFLEGLREITAQLRIPLVFDEVITGFRLAYGGAQEFYNVVPDAAVYGKGLGAGYPIGAIGASRELMTFFEPASPDSSRIYALGSSHGNPLSATAAVANLTELKKPGVYERLRDYGNQLRAGLAELFERSGLSVHMTGAGPIVEFFFTSEAITDYRSTWRSNMALKRALGQGMPGHGVFGGGGRFDASTCHGEAELKLMLGAVEASLQDARNAGLL
jgi:glutamate-1-semialdehyde 2,1-aminomutase